MATPFRTPLRSTGNEGVHGMSRTGGKVKAVDLVTGKAKVEYFFDPSLLLTEERTETPFKSSSNGSASTPYRKDLSTAFDADSDPLMTGSKHLFMPCTIIKPLDATDDERAASEPIAAPTLVKTSDGTLHKITDSTRLIKLTSPDDYMGISDVLHLPSVSEASLVHTLRLRYRRDEIYTSAGPILLSINPYKMITFPNGESLYSENVMLQYRKRTELEQELAPHLFQVADRAYSALLASVHPGIHMDEEDPTFHTAPGVIRNQSIIISGESGAGKTEATKYIMQYLARITKRPDAAREILSPDGRKIAALEDRVLSSNPLLESFGNARTLRNDNSSRFGKFIHIFFSTDSGTITGASISNYLLEKTRITHQAEGERNYHIFYQLLAGADDEMLSELGLSDGVSGFQYLGNRDAQKSRRDASAFVETKECLTSIGLSLEDQRIVFSIVAAVLHLGNIDFEERGNEAEEDKHSEADNAKISDTSRSSLEKASDLLGLDPANVSEAILTKLLYVGGKTIHKSQSVGQAAEKRDAFAKLTYSCLFLWLVQRVNETIKQDGSGLADDDSVDDKVHVDSGHSGFIGVLDIYGFEVFEVNGYEQLLINYCNEKLQRHFNRHLFEVEQDLYASEGVDWTYITFNDNRLCLELIEGGGGAVGILNTLDDAWGGMGSSSEKDVKFVSHLHKLFGNTGSPSKSSKKKKKGKGHASHKHYVTPKFGNDRQFLIVHYAGDVRYTANGFVEKNMETLSNELKDLGAESTVSLAKDVFQCGSSVAEDDPESRRSTIRGVSVASQFKASLQTLVADLERTQPHYIRCIKPNLSKASNSFDSGEVLRQLRYSGMMEAIRIRREGYALREDHESFYNRFSVLLQPEDFGEEAGIEQLVKVLSKRLAVTDADWQIGHSKIFLRRELATKLERLAALKVHAAARTVSRFGRFVAQRRASKALAAWARFRLHMVKKHRMDRAANIIVASYRGYKQQEQYTAIRTVALTLQSHQRRRLACEHVRSLRDPYADCSFKEMKKIYKEELARLDDAVKRKDFKAATAIEKLIKEIEASMESKRPRTRSLLEAEIAEVQKCLDDALERKAYEECGPLQEKLESLVAERVNLPTIDELREKLAHAEKDVADAAERRDFASAASGQTRIDEAKLRLEEAIAAEAADDDESSAKDENDDYGRRSSGFASRAELEAAISDLQEKVKQAIESKDFAAASSLQSALDDHEQLREHLPTVVELEERLKDADERLDNAVKNKDFTLAGTLHDEIDELQKKLAKEKDMTAATNLVAGIDDSSTLDESLYVASYRKDDGEEVVFTSRVDLEDEISRTSKRVSDAVASKEFRKADELQSIVDGLEALRTKLPSLAELQTTLKEKNEAMDKAVKAKKFAQAEEMHNEIENLQARIATEASKIPASDDRSSKSAPRGTSAASSSGGAIQNSKAAKTPSSITTPKLRRDAKDDMSEVSLSSEIAPSSKAGNGMDRASKSSLRSLGESNLERPVSKLRPRKPLISSSNDSILSMTQMLANKRSDASLIVDDTGALVGIITDTDITRRVVAKDIDPSLSTVSVAMTPNPTCVSMSDSAMDALSTMVENHFRHLPVVDDSGSVVGLLDIAKCLNDAISKLERAQEKGSSVAQDAVSQAVSMQGAGATQAAAIQALLGPLMAQAFGSQTSPSLRSLLAGKPATVVGPDTSVKEAGMIMAEHRKAALVVEDGQVIGIFDFKDMMRRAVSKELPLELTEVRLVMTPNPESVSPEITVLEALHMMHDHRFLTLPVCESDGRVVGLVDVMDVIYGCGGSKGWQSIFSRAMDVDDESDASSVYSRDDVSRVARSLHSTHSVPKKDIRPVSQLRPKKPLISLADDSILSVTQMLTNKRGDASLIVDANGGLAGIITDTDITRRVVAADVDPAATAVSVSMTPNPTCVSMLDSAMDALGTMVENHFRHLPVVDETGAVVGLLDIAKCLDDAILKLERAHEKGSNAAEDAVVQVAELQGADRAQAAALQALLGPLMAQAFGNQTSPSLRSLLAGKPATVVSPTSSIRDAAILMSEHRKAALVVEDGQLVGIFDFKDMMTRAVAKDLPLAFTDVSSVMTPNPESVSPEMTLLEALQTMHDHRFLTLPVCESDGHVLGLVDVMDVIYGCGGAEGWRSVFSSAMEVDDASDASTAYSRSNGSRAAQSARSTRSATKMEEERPVSKLRPKKPLLSSSNDSILSMTQMLTNKRGDASLVVDSSGALVGIITDTDVTCRVVAKDVDPASSTVSVAMTPNPTCVSMSDSAMDALGTMVDNHFRHLPVVDDTGAVIGLLDIAKCLNDAISKLERAHEKDSNAAEKAVEQVAGLQGAGGAQVAALQALLGPLMAQAFGNQTSPSLRSLLAGKPATVVGPDTSVKEAGMLMAERRKAALVVEDGQLIGIFGFKDMMSRAVSKELPLELTEVRMVMTANPESVLPDITVLEALQIMHDHRFLTLPVCESDGRVVGLVDVMDVIYGCGGAEGWRSVFQQTIGLEDGSESISVHSRGSATRSLTNKSQTKSRTDSRPVSKLRPKKPVVVSSEDTVLHVSRLLAQSRNAAAIVADSSKSVSGILTDHDITNRVVAMHKDAAATTSKTVMTSNPPVVSMSESASDALSMMIENHYRYLPVLDDSGSVSGLLDIGKCLNDAIYKLEHAQEKSSGAAGDAVKQMAALQGADGVNAAALQALLAPIMAQAFGSKTSPTLRTLLSGRAANMVHPQMSVLATAEKMAERQKAALVVDDGALVGILSFKDVMTRVIAKELPLEETPVSNVMTPDPEAVSPDTTVLEALQIMHDHNFLTLPVCESDGGEVLGLVDVMDLIYGCGGTEGWRSIFDSAMNIDDDGSETQTARIGSNGRPPVVQVAPGAPFASASVPSNIPACVEIDQDARSDHGSLNESLITDTRALSTVGSPPPGANSARTVVFKLTDPGGHTHRIRSELDVSTLLGLLVKKMGKNVDADSIRMKFVDDEGDAIMITSNDCLAEAAQLALKSGSEVVKLSVTVVKSKELKDKQQLVVAGAAAAIALGAIAILVAFKRR